MVDKPTATLRSEPPRHRHDGACAGPPSGRPPGSGLGGSPRGGRAPLISGTAKAVAATVVAAVIATIHIRGGDAHHSNRVLDAHEVYRRLMPKQGHLLRYQGLHREE